LWPWCPRATLPPAKTQAGVIKGARERERVALWARLGKGGCTHSRTSRVPRSTLAPTHCPCCKHHHQPLPSLRHRAGPSPPVNTTFWCAGYEPAKDGAVGCGCCSAPPDCRCGAKSEARGAGGAPGCAPAGGRGWHHHRLTLSPRPRAGRGRGAMGWAPGAAYRPGMCCLRR
jgi:hypothetical protein